MKKHIMLKLIYFGMAVGILTAGCTVTLSDRDDGDNPGVFRSPAAIAVSHNDSTLYIAESTARRIVVFDTKTNSVTGEISLSFNPAGVAVHPGGTRLYISGGAEKGIVSVVDLNTHKETIRIPVGHTPCSPVISPDGSALVVCNRFDDNLSVIDTALNRVIANIPMLREPIAAAFTTDGAYLLVANHLPTANQIKEYVADGGYMHIDGYQYSSSYAAQGFVVVVDVATQRLKAIVQLPEGSTLLKGICISPDGRYAYVTHILARYKQATRTVDNGAINTNALSIIDTASMELLGTVLLDDPDKGAANPWGVTCSPDGENLFVAHAGSHEISSVNLRAFHQRLADRLDDNGDGRTGSADSLHYDLSFMNGIRQRIQLKGNGPRALAVFGKRLYVTEYFSDSLALVTCDDTGVPSVSSFPLSPWKPETDVRRGERYFNDAILCRQMWQSCASCHPDGRSDGLNWDLLNDGEGNPKNTRSLLLSHVTPPSMITGIRPTAEIAVLSGLEHILFNEAPELYRSSINAYLRSMKPVPSPHLVNGKMNRNARKGKRVFIRAGCAECHPGGLYTDMKPYNVGTGIGNERNAAFDTPTLIELWRTAPYLYDGRGKSGYDIVTTFNRRELHGATADLDPEERINLVEFILSL